MFDRRCAETQARNLTSAADLAAQMPTTCICRADLSDKSMRKGCGQVWSSSGVHSIKIRDSHAPGPALQNRGSGWPIATSNPRSIFEVREAAVNAINIDDGEAEAHVYLAETKRILDWDLRGAEAEYLRAFEIDSNSTTSNYFIAAFYAAIGEREKALTYLGRTAKIDPASLWVSNFACEIYRYFGLIDEAMAAGERSLQLDPTFLL